eukprot:TRINITY_DN1943_c2_g1_i1.p1 TRINITY_DN1943_c2_g1~~TRINITY_DN1943_c2_g1_i1.p1  ORF type:complete len:434 (+),score=65.15 TRINITY_DN1943_c2_g1_i1:42-1343(+)
MNVNYCSLGVNCHPWWSISPLQYICKDCVENDLSKLRGKLAEEAKWRQKKEKILKEALEARLVESKKRARHEALLREVDEVRRKLKASEERNKHLREKSESVKEKIKKKNNELLSLANRHPKEALENTNPWLYKKVEHTDSQLSLKLMAARQARIGDLLSVFPLKSCSHSNHWGGFTVCDSLCLPCVATADSLGAFTCSGVRYSATLGLFSYVVKAIAEILDVPLPFNINSLGSASTIEINEPVVAMSKGWWDRVVDSVVTQFTATSSGTTGQFVVNDLAVTQLDAPLWYSDKPEHTVPMYRGIAALNANIIAILYSQKVVLQPHRMALEPRGVDVPFDYILVRNLSQVLTFPKLGYPNWRTRVLFSLMPTPADSGSSAPPAASPIISKTSVIDAHALQSPQASYFDGTSAIPRVGSGGSDGWVEVEDEVIRP